MKTTKGGVCFQVVFRDSHTHTYIYIHIYTYTYFTYIYIHIYIGHMSYVSECTTLKDPPPPFIVTTKDECHCARVAFGFYHYIPGLGLKVGGAHLKAPLYEDVDDFET